MDVDLIPIENLEDLRARAYRRAIEVRLLLNGGAFSRKTVRWNANRQRWFITNHIDDTKQQLTDGQLWTESNIGKGLDLGAIVRRA